MRRGICYWFARDAFQVYFVDAFMSSPAAGACGFELLSPVDPTTPDGSLIIVAPEKCQSANRVWFQGPFDSYAPLAGPLRHTIAVEHAPVSVPWPDNVSADSRSFRRAPSRS